MADAERVRALRNAAALVQQDWCQGTLAKDAAGHSVPSSDATAVQRCLVSALCAACYTLKQWPTHYELDSLFDQIRAAAGIEGSLSIWNDAPERTQAEVVAALETTAARLEE